MADQYTMPTPGTPEYARWRVNQAYEQYLGRSAGDADYNAHLGNGRLYQQSNIDAAINTIRTSQEARDRGAQPPPSTTYQPAGGQGPAQTPGTTPPTTPSTPPPAADRPDAPPPTMSDLGTTPYTDRGSGSGADGWSYTGYDFNQDADNRLIGKSAKYTMAEAQRIAKAAGASDSWKSKEGAAEFANQWLKKYLEDNGFEVLEIVGDKMKIRDHADRAAGREGSWVDWVVNAGGPNAQLGWQVEQTQDAFGAPETYVPPGFTPRQPAPVTPPTSSTQPTGTPQQPGPDRWNRPPGDPQWGIDPNAYVPTMSDLGQNQPELL